MRAVCEDCELHPQIAGSAFCRTCDAWNNRCVGRVFEGRYSNGSPMFTARCEFCGWQATGSFGSRATATAIAAPHTKAPVNV